MRQTQLWRVTVEHELVVAANSEREAESEAQQYAGDDGTVCRLIFAHKIIFIDELPEEWMDSLPFGGDKKDERTCKQRILK